MSGALAPDEGGNQAFGDDLADTGDRGEVLLGDRPGEGETEGVVDQAGRSGSDSGEGLEDVDSPITVRPGTPSVATWFWTSETISSI